jgi:hypothetical protein
VDFGCLAISTGLKLLANANNAGAEVDAVGVTQQLFLKLLEPI